MINEAYGLVKIFQSQAKQPVSNKPTFLSQDRVSIRYTWMKEELEEFFEAQNIYEQVDSIIDLLYYALGTLVELGVEPDELFILLHEWNLKKLDKICFVSSREACGFHPHMRATSGSLAISYICT